MEYEQNRVLREAGEIVRSLWSNEEESVRFRCVPLMAETKDALMKIIKFRNQAVISFFESETKEVEFTISRTKWHVSYYRKERNHEEDIMLTKNDEERIRIHTFTTDPGRSRGSVTYSEEPPFTFIKYMDDEKALTEAQRFIEELEKASK
jgi:hypothetical protein